MHHDLHVFTLYRFIRFITIQTFCTRIQPLKSINVRNLSSVFYHLPRRLWRNIGNTIFLFKSAKRTNTLFFWVVSMDDPFYLAITPPHLISSFAHRVIRLKTVNFYVFAIKCFFFFYHFTKTLKPSRDHTNGLLTTCQQRSASWWPVPCRSTLCTPRLSVSNARETYIYSFHILFSAVLTDPLS